MERWRGEEGRGSKRRGSTKSKHEKTPRYAHTCPILEGFFPHPLYAKRCGMGWEQVTKVCLGWFFPKPAISISSFRTQEYLTTKGRNTRMSLDSRHLQGNKG